MRAEHQPETCSAGAAPRPRTVTTDEAPPGQAFAWWQELISDTFVPLTAAPTTERPFRGRILHSTVGQVELTTVRSSGQHVRRTPRLISHSSEECVLASIQVAGCGEVSQGGRAALLRPPAALRNRLGRDQRRSPPGGVIDTEVAARGGRAGLGRSDQSAGSGAAARVQPSAVEVAVQPISGPVPAAAFRWAASCCW